MNQRCQKIKMIGIGTAGSKLVEQLPSENSKDISYLSIMKDNPSPSIPDRQLSCGISDKAALRQVLDDGTDTVIIIARLGGETGSEVGQTVAQTARELGLRTIAIVSLPFHFEGKKKLSKAQESVLSLKRLCDILVTVDNNRLISYFEDLTFGNAFNKADEIHTRAICTISAIIQEKGFASYETTDLPEELTNTGIIVSVKQPDS